MPGVCRITGKQAVGVIFEKWVKDTFTDHGFLKPGTIISNEALFCFDEKSTIIQRMKGRDKHQKFRTYSHLVDASGSWLCLTKADKPQMLKLICEGATLVCLSDSGQKHLLFKHRPGMWQLDDIFIIPDVETLQFLHAKMMNMLALGFSQTEVITGHYLQYRIIQCGLATWKQEEDTLKKYRGIPIFNFTAWLLYTIK